MTMWQMSVSVNIDETNGVVVVVVVVVVVKK